MKRTVWMLLFAVLFFLTACGSKEEEDEKGYSLFYLSSSETKLVAQKEVLTAEDLEGQIAEISALLSQTPGKLEYKAPFAMSKLLNTRLSDGKLTLDMDASYRKLAPTTEILVRAAIVRTFTQLEGIQFVSITVEGEQLYDATGTPIGFMSAELFINNDGNEINTYEKTRVRLYFANSDGDKIIAAYREKLYSTNTPLERFVIEELIAGPSGQIAGLYPVISPDTRILSISTRDGICYVNFDSAFLNAVNNVTTDAKIYSVVNTLVELNHINKVQILVNGEVPGTFSVKIFERNLDFVTTLEP